MLPTNIAPHRGSFERKLIFQCYVQARIHFLVGHRTDSVAQNLRAGAVRRFWSLFLPKGPSNGFHVLSHSQMGRCNGAKAPGLATGKATSTPCKGSRITPRARGIKNLGPGGSLGRQGPGRWEMESTSDTTKKGPSPKDEPRTPAHKPNRFPNISQSGWINFE